MRKTKIVCTIGPASESSEMIEKLCLAGMNVARLNFSHGSHEEHKKRIDTIREVSSRLNLPIAVLLDTKGPEFRIRTFENGKISLKAGDRFTFRSGNGVGNQECVYVNFEGLSGDVKPGDHILVCNGLMDFVVREISGDDVVCETLTDGVLSDRKSMNFPGKVMSTEYLSEQDKADILFGIENEVDFIACSFVSKADDLRAVREFLSEHGSPDIELIAKIENQPGIDNIEEICELCSGIMIGRGDMGVEIAPEKLPAVQKSLITKCRLLGKRVITATEMLESMINSPRPTRAEVSDVANAVYDGTSAVMLSGETAAGKYPEQTVKMMASIAEATEASIHYEKRFHNYSFEMKNTVDCISHAVELHFHVQQLIADGHDLTGLDWLAEIHEDIAQMGIGDLIITIADDLIYTMNGIRADSRHRSCSQGCQDVSSGLEVYSVMEKCLSCLGMLLLAIAK